MPENMTVVTSTPVTMTEANAQTITIIGGDQYPVSSVNGKTGAVVLDADDVGAVATETGKGLSTNDYTDADKEKVDNAVQLDEFKYQYTNTLTTPATITDSNGGKISNAVITGESTQDGTPTPTAPIDIDNTGDTLKLTSCGKNLFNISKVVTNNAVTNNGDSLTVTTSSTSAAMLAGSPNTLRDYIGNCEGMTLTLNAQTTGTTKQIYLNSAKKVWAFGTSKMITKEMLNSAVYFYASGNSTTATISKIQFEVGSTATAYEPYSCSTYTIPLTDTDGTTHTMRMFDSVKKHDDGKWYFESNSNVVNFDGTENWNIYSDYSCFATPSISVRGKRSNIICSRTPYISYASTDNRSFQIGNAMHPYANSGITTLDAWKSQLAAWNTAGNPLTVLYQTATTTSYELNATAQTTLNSMALQKGNANIYFTNAVAPGMTADYPRNLQLYCKSLEARIEALENIQ